tara:strand:- start:47 stop:685 length:639 start_codon:yes stop_codon:yes gene_type:complete
MKILNCRDKNQIIRLLVLVVSETRFPIGLVLASVFLSLIIASWQVGVLFVDSEPDEEDFWEFFGPCILVLYLLFLIRYFVVNEGRKYTVSAFSTSVILSTIGAGMYDTQVGGWFWNDDWVMEEALIATIRPVIILLLLNEFFGLADRAGNRTANAGQNYLTSLIRIGLIASLPLVVLNPLLAIGTIIFIPTIILFFIFYWASTETPSRLDSG